MKKIILLSILLSILTFLFFGRSISVLSLEEAATNSSLKNEKLEKIRELKEKVAEKVAELKEEELNKIIGNQTKVYSGIIKKIEDETIILQKKDQDIKIEVSNQTKFIWINTDGRKLKITFSDFTVGDQIVVWGTIDQETGAVKAKTISGRLRPFIFSCLVYKIDLENKTLFCQNKNKKRNYELLISNVSKIFIWQKKQGLKKQDFENIKVGMKLLVKGVVKEKDKGKVTTLLLISF